MESIASRTRFIAERVNRGLSLNAAAATIGIHRNTLVAFEAGESVSLASAKAIADFYGCKVTDFVAIPGASDADLDEAA